MVWIEAPKQDRLQHAKHPCCQVGTPHAARAVIVLAAHHRVPQDALRRVIVHRPSWALDKDREAIPGLMQAAKNLFLAKWAARTEKMRFTPHLHRAKGSLQC